MSATFRRPLAILVTVAVVLVVAGTTVSRPSLTPRTVVGWGRDSWGQASPPEVPDAVAIDAGAAHSIALTSAGTVVAWGDNWGGQTAVPAGLTGVIAISAGGYHNLALKSDKTVVGWGGVDQYGQGEVPGGITDAIGVAAGGFFSAILHKGGTVTAWGREDSGQLEVPPGLTGVTKIVAGWAHVLALKGDKTVVAWGYNGSGQCSVPGGLTNVADIAAGEDHSFALTEGGTLYVWGYNNHGQGSNLLGLASPRSFDGGEYNSVAVNSAGAVVGWGYDLWGLPAVPSIYTSALSARCGREHGIAILEDRTYLSVSKKSVKNVFPAGKADSCSVTATFIDPPGGLNPASAGVTVFVGGAAETFILDAKGAGKVGKSSFKLKLKDGVWTASIKLSGEYSAAWEASAGLLNRNEEYAAALPVQIDFGAGRRYVGTPRLWYKTVADKAGSGK